MMKKKYIQQILVVFFATSILILNTIEAQEVNDKYISLESGFCFERIPESVISNIYGEQQSAFNQHHGISQAITFNKVFFYNKYIGVKSGFGIAHYNYKQEVKNSWYLKKHSFFLSIPLELMLKLNLGTGYLYFSNGIYTDLYAFQYNQNMQITTDRTINSYFAEPYLFNLGAQNLRFNDVSPWKHFSMPVSFSYSASFGAKFRITQNRFIGVIFNFRLFELVSLYPSNLHTETLYTSSGIENIKTKWYPIHLSLSLAYYF